MRHELYKALEKPNVSKYGKVVQRAILVNVLLNISVSLLYIFFEFNTVIQSFLLTVEYFTVFIFCIELVLRYIAIGYDTRFRGLVGKLRYTLTPFILIDILSLIPYFVFGIPFDSLLGRIVRFLKYFKVLKLLRLKDVIRNIFSLSFFATTSILVQFAILFAFSIFFIAVFAVILKNIKLSVMIFLDPVAVAEIATYRQTLVGFFELIIGLIVGGTLISIISSLLTNILTAIKSGYYPYRGKGHYIIVNYNSKVEFILKEINSYYFDLEESQDVVLYLPHIENLEDITQNLRKYSNLRIFINKGYPFIWKTYKRLNLNGCSKIIILKQSNNTSNYLESKITRYILSHQYFNQANLHFTIEATHSTDLIIYEEIFSQSANTFDVIDSNSIIQNLLNRLIINSTYFEIYSALLSFENWQISNIDYKNIFNTAYSFKDACMHFSGGLIIGLIRDGALLINPNKELLLIESDIIIAIVREKYNYNIISELDISGTVLEVRKPQLKSNRKICIIGDFDTIRTDNINDFLDCNSIASLEREALRPNNEYLATSFWDQIITHNYDMIILNLEDEFEFVLTMYLRRLYANNLTFLNSLINIIHDPTTAKLLYRNDHKNNVILSEKLVGEFIAQALFNNSIIAIFEELTRSVGSEFYLLDKAEYEAIFDLGIIDLKRQLLQNDMIYIGAIINDKFIVNSQQASTSEQIVVLAQGI